jgi:UDP-glucose 4-epimerase
MRVCITGGAGAIGRFVVEELDGRGHEVRVFDVTDPDYGEGTFRRGDVTDAEAVADAVAGVDVVVHMAALLPPACREDPVRAESVNVGGTLHAFEAALDAGVRVVYVSSKAVFGPITGRFAHPTYDPLGEEARKSPTSVYGKTKLACEEYLHTYRERGLDAAGVRFASTYGPGKGEAHGDLALIPEAVEAAAAGEDVALPGGDQRNDFVYYRDLARGIRCAVEADSLTHPVYHLGSGAAVPMRAVGAALRERTGASVTVADGLDFYDRGAPTYCRLDVSRARADLGYEPAFPVERAIEDYLDRLGA